MNTDGKMSFDNNSESLTDVEKSIFGRLRLTIPEEAYERWVENFIIESISEKEVVIGYYGTESLREFKRNYMEFLRVGICSTVGYVKKIKLYQRNPDKGEYTKAGKHRRTKVAFVFILLSLGFAALAFLGAVAAINYFANKSFAETFYTVSSIKTDKRVRVIQISDLHSCEYGENNKDLLSRVEKLEPDVIIMTGDCVDKKAASADGIAELCKGLAKTAPTYYIYGNNEIDRVYGIPFAIKDIDEKYGFSGDRDRNPRVLIDEADEFKAQIEKSGVKVLKNSWDTITVGDIGVDIFGVLTSNPSAFWPYAGEEFEEFAYTNPENLKITAVHEPFIFEEYEFEDFGDLLVCGHTHGGMVNVPILGALYTPEWGLFPERGGHYIYGRYDTSGCPLIVSSGLDNSSILRIYNKPELVIIDINRF